MHAAFVPLNLTRHSNTVTCEWGGNEAGEHSLQQLRLADSHRSQKTIVSEFQWIGAVFAGLFGLAFGSFLNVVLARFPEGESIVSPPSHCRHCDHTLAWWENFPVLSWIVLRGRCRQCRTWIGVRYPLVELAVGLLWAACWLRFAPPPIFINETLPTPAHSIVLFLGYCVLCWLLLALAILDAEFFWLPDWFTWPGIGLGIAFSIALLATSNLNETANWIIALPSIAMQVILAAGVVLIIRLAYWLIRRQEGMGLGDAKLMAMLAAWLGLRGALECFAIAIFAACIAAFVWIAILIFKGNREDWGKMPLPLGTFLCAAALTEIFYPAWLTGPMHLEMLGLGK